MHCAALLLVFDEMKSAKTSERAARSFRRSTLLRLLSERAHSARPANYLQSRSEAFRVSKLCVWFDQRALTTRLLCIYQSTCGVLVVSRPIPEEGSLLLRPLRGMANSTVAQSVATTSRLVSVPPRTVHAHLGFPRPRPLSNDLFVELRYSMPPSLIAHFEYDDLRHGLFRAFILPEYEGDGAARIVLTLDEIATTAALRSAPPQQYPRANPALVPAWARSVRIEAFLGAASGSPPSHAWRSTLDADFDEVVSLAPESVRGEAVSAEAAAGLSPSAASLPVPGRKEAGGEREAKGRGIYGGGGGDAGAGPGYAGAGLGDAC
eukprot:1855743-Pleurochrysis_carterae.AAC.1